MSEAAPKRLPMTIYHCKFMDGTKCTFSGINVPTGGRISYGTRRCDQSASRDEDKIECDEKVIESTEILAYVSESGMLS